MDLIERIKKLYNLSTRNSSTAEAAAAAAKIQELCFQNELDLAKILEQGTDPAIPYVKYDFILPDTLAFDVNVNWKKLLCWGVAKANFCSGVSIPGTARMAIIGQKHNYEVVCYTYEYLAREICRLAVEHCVAQAFLDKKDRKNYIAGFCEGAATEVYRALCASVKQQAAATRKSRALVVVKNAELNKAVSVYFPRLIKERATPINGSSAGYRDGRQFGKGISITRGVARNNHRQINDALLGSLKELVNSPNAKSNAAWDRARAALAKAKAKGE